MLFICMHEQSRNHISLKKKKMLCKVTHCAGRILANTRPHQLCWGDREMAITISCTKCSQVAGLTQKVSRSSLKSSFLCVYIWYFNPPSAPTYAHTNNFYTLCVMPCRKADRILYYNYITNITERNVTREVTTRVYWCSPGTQDSDNW